MRRMLSARRVKINELRNDVEQLTQQLGTIQQDNRTLRRQQALQEKALVKYEDQESDVTFLLQKHSEEVRVLREQLRRNKEKFHKTEHKLKDTEEDLAKTKRQLNKLKKIAEDRNLGERDELSRKLNKAETDIDDKDKRIRVSFVVLFGT